MNFADTAANKPLPTKLAGVYVANMTRPVLNGLLEKENAVQAELAAVNDEDDNEADNETDEPALEDRPVYKDYLLYLFTAPVVVDENGQPFPDCATAELIDELPPLSIKRTVEALQATFRELSGKS